MFKAIAPLALLLVIGLAFADPMRPDTMRPRETSRPAPAPEPSLTLTSVYIVADERFAVINNQWLALGDNIHHYKIMDITPESVVLQRGQRMRELTLTQAGELAITATNED